MTPSVDIKDLTFEQPLPELVAQIAREAAIAAVKEHVKSCPFIMQDVEKRLRSLEMTFWRAVGLVADSLGGGAALGKWLF